MMNASRKKRRRRGEGRRTMVLRELSHHSFSLSLYVFSSAALFRCSIRTSCRRAITVEENAELSNLMVKSSVCVCVCVCVRRADKKGKCDNHWC